MYESMLKYGIGAVFVYVCVCVRVRAYVRAHVFAFKQAVLHNSLQIHFHIISLNRRFQYIGIFYVSFMTRNHVHT